MLFQVYHLDMECGCALVKEFETSQSKSIGLSVCGCAVLWIVDRIGVRSYCRGFKRRQRIDRKNVLLPLC